jgi:hypothetical protein
VSFLEGMAQARTATTDTEKLRVLENEPESDRVSSAHGPSTTTRIAELEQERKGTEVARRKLHELMRESARIDPRYNEIEGMSVRFCL